MGATSTSDQESDAELSAALRRGDLRALGEAFDRHAKKVFVFSLRRCGNRAQAEDATSSTFLEFWRVRERTVVSEGSLLPWLLGIATNVLRSAERASRRRLRALSRLAADGPTPDHADAVVDLVDGMDQAVRLRAVLASLREEERDLLSLSVFGDLTMRQIADVVGVPEGTVKSRLSRLRSRVAVELRLAGEGVTA